MNQKKPNKRKAKEVVQVFKDNNVRIIIEDGIEWFVAKDVCNVLGYANTSKAISAHCKGITKRYSLVTASGEQSLLTITEPDIYRLIVRSKLPTAQKFECWIMEDVLPSIRKTGKYDIRDVAQTSKDNRNAFTAECKRQGLKHPSDYAHITAYSYSELFNNSKIRKQSMNKEQMLKLSAFEAFEAYKYSILPENALQLSGIKESMKNTALQLNRVEQLDTIETINEI